MDSTDARTLALRAISRGLLRPADLWDLAWTCGKHDGDPVDRVLETTLGATQLETLAAREATDSVAPLSVSPQSSADRARYTQIDELGKGGMGQVVAAVDKETERVVALKTLNPLMADDPFLVERFVEEARVTAQLEHPNIIPVYDLGTDAEGRRFFTMRVVKQRSLRDVLKDAGHRAQWSPVRLLGALVQVSRALAYAHSRGVVHRDVKPANILLGDFGEVYLADWGFARISPRSELYVKGRADDTRPAFGGTPGYIAPEVLNGTWDGADPRVDLFAAGVILYEVLTGRKPFKGDSAEAVMKRTAEESPERPRELAPDCPLLLEDLCLSLLAKSATERPSSAAEVAERIEGFLEGAKERDRRREEARDLCLRAEEPVKTYERLEKEQEILGQKARELLANIKPCEPIEKKRPAWELLDRAGKIERESAVALARAIELYTAALGYDVACADAHRGLASLYWARAREAESQRRLATQGYYEELLRDHDDGRYAAILSTKARLSLASNPPGAVVTARPYVERDRVLVAGEGWVLGATPLVDVELDPGSYLFTLATSGFREVRCPVLLTRGKRTDLGVNLYTEDEIGEGFVFVPGGPAILGGDTVADGAVPRGEYDVGDFAIARFPVTFREYCAFLDDLDRADPSLALKRAPHDLRGSEGLAVVRGLEGHWEPGAFIIEGPARDMFRAADGHLWNVPVSLIDWFDAVAFCRWRSARDGTEVRLPGEAEWEKAARGTDGRTFPWGDHFDATFCKMRDSRPFMQQPEPNGTFPVDVSPYGVGDMAGGMREWTGDILGVRSAAELAREPEPSEGTARDAAPMRMVRSGSWMTESAWSRSATRGAVFGLLRGTGLGFRVAKSLGRR